MIGTNFDTVFSLLSHVALSVLLIGASAKLALWTCRDTAATLRHTLAISALAGVVVVPAFVVAAHYRTVATATIKLPALAPPNTTEDNIVPVSGTSATTESFISSSTSDAAASGWRDGILRTFCVVWGTGVVVAIMFVSRGWFHQREYLLRLDHVADSEILDTVERLRVEMGIHRPVEILRSRIAPWPFTVGLLKPKVILPFELLKGDCSESDQLKAAVAHELGHVKRCDYAVLMLEQFVRVLLWWNPFVTSISTSLSVAREEICDSLVLQYRGDGSSLADYLVVSMERAANAKFVWGVGMSANEPEIVKLRIKRLMTGDTNLMKIPIHKKALLFFSAILLAVACVQASYAQSELRFGDPINLGETVNAGDGQVGITIGNRDLTIMYHDVAAGVVIVPGELIPARIWETNRASTESDWQTPSMVGELAPLDGGFALIAPKLSDDGLTLLYSQTYVGPGEDIWMATRTDVDQPWQGMHRLPEPVNSSEGFLGSNAATISHDGNTMFFSSDRPGSEGKDLWQVTLNNEGQWDNPMRLPEPINSPHREAAPEISSDGLMLFFSSDRPGGFGNFDLYVSQRSDIAEPWGPPMNLGGAINTERNENNPGLSSDDSLLYFRTSGLGGFGGNDIWSVTVVPEPSTTSMAICGFLLFAGLYRRRK